MFEVKIIGNKVKIVGNVKSLSHYDEIKNSVDTVISNRKKDKDVIVELVDSISLTSSVIGYFNFTKIVNKDGINLKVLVNDERLYELLNDLGLVSLFQVGRGSK